MTFAARPGLNTAGSSQTGPFRWRMVGVDLPVAAPVDPMLAKAVTSVPDDPGRWSYEPKWDGFLH